MIRSTVDRRQRSRSAACDGLDSVSATTGILSPREERIQRYRRLGPPEPACKISPSPSVARTAHELGAREVVFGRSGRLAPDVQAESFAIRWGAVEPDSERDMTVRIVSDGEDLRFAL